MAERGVEAVPLVVEAVVRVELVAVLDPDPAAAGQHQVRGQAEPGPGHLAYRIGGLEVPGQIAVVVAGGVDDLAASLGHGEQRGTQGVVLAQDLRRGGLREPEQLDHVTGQHHGDRAGLGGQAARQHLTRPRRDLRAPRRQVQVADREHRGAGRDLHVQQVGHVGLG